MKHVYDDGGRLAAGYRGKTGDCVCRSIAIVTCLPYQMVYDALAEGNAKQRRSKHHLKGTKSARDGIHTTRKWFGDYMTSLGFRWVPTMQVGSGCKVHLKEGELPMGRLVVNVSKHMTAVIDGVLHDNQDCTRGGKRCVYGYYILERKLVSITTI